MGIRGVTQRSGGGKMVLKTAERNFVKTVKISSIGTGVEKLLKNAF